jgi:hypothetical protein
MTHLRMRGAAFAALCVLAAEPWMGKLDSTAAPGGDFGADAALLAEHGVEPTRLGVKTFLRQLKVEMAGAKAAEDLIPKLGDEAFRVREAATQRLIDAPFPPVIALQKAAASADREIASRAKQVLRHPKVASKVDRAESLPFVGAAVFRTMQKSLVQGATAELFDVVAFLNDRELLDAACEAAAATASREDAALIGEYLASKSTNIKIAAIRALAKSDIKIESVAGADLRALLKDADSRIVLAAAHTLADRGDRRALAAFVDLATSQDEFVRARGEQILRAWTGRHFGFNPFQDPSSQKETVARWRAWVAAEGATAPLNAPLRLQPLPEDLRRGLVLHYAFDEIANDRLTDGSGHKRHGAPKNQHSLVAGIAGRALEVRGAGDYGDAGGHVAVPFIDFMALEEFTVALWVYERGMSQGEGEAYIVFGADRTVVLDDSLGISHFNNQLIYRVGGALVQVPFDPADRNRWVHHALTFQGGRLKAYKNGRLVGEANGRVAIVGKHAALGRHWWHHGEATSTRFIGAFDELRIYRRALSPAQLELLRMRPQ